MEIRFKYRTVSLVRPPQGGSDSRIHERYFGFSRTHEIILFTNHERNRFHEFSNDFTYFHEFTNEKKPTPACTNTAGGL